MSIRSIDMQVLIPKATEVGKQQNNLTQQSTLQQQQFSEEMKKMVLVRQQQVQGMEKSQGSKVEREETKDKHKKRSPNYAHNPDKLEKELPEQENTESTNIGKDPLRGHIIDIKT